MIVLDASAILAYFMGEPGADDIEAALETEDVVCAAANWSETAQKMLAAGRNWDDARALVLEHGLRVEPVTVDDAESAAVIWLTHRHLSLADRTCLALSRRLEAEAWTTDRAWGEAIGIRQLR